jgi:hypothetical protein
MKERYYDTVEIALNLSWDSLPTYILKEMILIKESKSKTVTKLPLLLFSCCCSVVVVVVVVVVVQLLLLLLFSCCCCSVVVVAAHFHSC